MTMIRLACLLTLGLFLILPTETALARQDTGVRSHVPLPNPYDHAQTMDGAVRIKGELVEYNATFGKQPVYDDDGNVIAGLFYTFYQRTNGAPIVERPLVISFNGGPGSASVWMHLGYTGPKKAHHRRGRLSNATLWCSG